MIACRLVGLEDEARSTGACGSRCVLCVLTLCCVFGLCVVGVVVCLDSWLTLPEP